MEWERIAEDDETKGDEWEDTGVVTGFFCVIKLLECCIDDVHHDVALQIERQEFIQCRVGVRPSRLT